jgi:LysR family transcriptional regulator, hydrogen peroxide-inducible genes activator
MEIHQLRYFVAAAECGNLSRAAERCHIAQPSLSQQLLRLEMGLGVRLFDRLGRGVAMTDAGRALLPRARRILLDVEDAQSNLRREAADAPRSLVVGAIPTMAPYLLPPALKSIRTIFPDCQISVRESLTENLVEALEHNQLDCALMSTPIESDLLELELLGEEDLLIAVPPTHPLAGQAQVSLTSLRGEPAVTLEEMHCLGRQIEGFCSSRHLGRTVVCRSTQLQTIVELVSLGAGYSIIPEMTAAAGGRGKKSEKGEKRVKGDRGGEQGCRYLRLRPARITRQIAVAWRKGRRHSVAASRFVELIAENLRTGRHRILDGK